MVNYPNSQSGSSTFSPVFAEPLLKYFSLVGLFFFYKFEGQGSKGLWMTASVSANPEKLWCCLWHHKGRNSRTVFCPAYSWEAKANIRWSSHIEGCSLHMRRLAPLRDLESVLHHMGLCLDPSFWLKSSIVLCFLPRSTKTATTSTSCGPDLTSSLTFSAACRTSRRSTTFLGKVHAVHTQKHECSAAALRYKYHRGADSKPDSELSLQNI